MTSPPVARQEKALVLGLFEGAPGGGHDRARSHCRFALPLIHFVPDSPRYSVPLLLKRQCDRTPRPGAATGRRADLAVRAWKAQATTDPHTEFRTESESKSKSESESKSESNRNRIRRAFKRCIHPPGKIPPKTRPDVEPPRSPPVLAGRIAAWLSILRGASQARGCLRGGGRVHRGRPEHGAGRCGPRPSSQPTVSWGAGAFHCGPIQTLGTPNLLGTSGTYM